MKNEWGEGAMLIIALLVTMVVVGFFAMKLTTNPQALIFIALLMLGVFAYITLVPWLLFALMAVASVFVYLAMRRNEV